MRIRQKSEISDSVGSFFIECALGARGGLPPDRPIHTIDDLERNHDAGMNEHVAKTLESEKLIALITKYVVLK